MQGAWCVHIERNRAVPKALHRLAQTEYAQLAAAAHLLADPVARGRQPLPLLRRVTRRLAGDLRASEASVQLSLSACMIGLALGRGTQSDAASHHTLREVFTGKTAILLLGGLAIGAISGPDGIKKVDAMYFALFQGVLMLFMLDMGMIAASRLAELRRGWLRLAAFATVVPLLHGVVGVFLAHACGMSVGSVGVFGAMLSSASYIAAPAAVRAGLPEADVGRCITAALGLTFPFNLAIGIPLYASLAQRLAA